MPTRRLFITASLTAPLLGCVTGTDMYPLALITDRRVETDRAIILIGSAGPGGVSYLQFSHSSLPAINVRQSFGNEILAFPVTVGLKQFALLNYTAVGQSSGYIGSQSYGYNRLTTTPINIERPDIYYVGTVYPVAGRVEAAPIPEQLARARVKYVTAFEGREPINFRWS